MAQHIELDSDQIRADAGANDGDEGADDQEWLPPDEHSYLHRKQRRRQRKRQQVKACSDRRKRKRSSRMKRHRYDYEEKAKAVAYYDSLGQESSRADRLKKASQGKDAPVIVASVETLAKWTTKKVRATIEDVLERAIADYAPGSDKVKHKGGRGKKACGRGVLVARKINGRRAAKYPEAEYQTVLWVKRMRGKGKKVTSRLTKARMRLHVRQQHPDDVSALVFKASSGWLKRFMGRYCLTWRRRNDNATKSVDELIPSVAKFINDLRAFRLSNPYRPSVLVDRNPPSVFDLKYGLYGPYNTFDVDQVPLPFASADPSTLEFIGTQRVWITTSAGNTAA